MKKKYLITLFIPLIFLTGCWDLNENERMYYIFGAGVDYQDEEYVISIQIISFSLVAKGEQLNQEAIQSQVSSVSGKTFDEALFKLYHSIDERVFWGHFSLLIFSDKALKEGRINSVVNDLTRFSDTRYNTWVYCTDEPLEQFLLALPLLNKAVTLTKIADPLNSYEQESFIEPIDLRNLIIKIDEPGHSANIPYIKLKEDWQTQKNPLSTIEIKGVGVVTPTEFKGFIKNDEANGLQWMTNESKRGEVTNNYEEDKYLSAVIRNVDVNIIPIVNGNDVKFDINIGLNATLASFEENLTSAKIKELVSQSVKEEINRTYQAALEKNIDIFRFSEILYRKDVKAWKKVQKNGNIELNDDTIGKINITVQKLASGRKTFKDTLK